MNKDNLAGFGIGILAGLLVGATIALLYAPQEGIKTRAMIKDEAIKVRDNTGKFVGKIAQKVKKTG
jgi:gas vesicle protein